MKINKNTIILLLSVLLIVNVVLKCQGKKIQENLQHINEAINDSLQVWKDNYSLIHAKIQIIQSEKNKTFLELETKNTEIIELQNEVVKFKDRLKKNGSVTVLNTETRFDTIYKTLRVPSENKNGDFLGQISNSFIQSDFGVKSDSIFFSLMVKNKYTIVLGEDKVGLFKKKPYVEVVNHNPYTDTKSVRTYQKVRKDKNWSLGPQITVGLTPDLKIQPCLGVGIQYSIFKF